MDPNTLERLLIDQSLGELSTDASELLEDYLESHPECAQSARDTEATITEARRALQHKPTASDETMPPLHPLHVIRSPRSIRSPKAWFQNLAVAAAVMIGFFLGSWHTSNPTPPGDKTIQFAEAVAKEPVATKQNDFWSLSRLRDTKDPHPSTNKPRIIWSNPIGKPHIGDQS